MTENVPQEWLQLVVADDYCTHNVYRDGNVVHKDAGPWTPTVHKLLKHLEDRGFPAPRIVGSGFDEAGRETISYVEGEVENFGPWSHEAVKAIGGLLRELHEATRDFAPPADAVWYPWWGRRQVEGKRVIGHCDLGPWNIVRRDGMPVAFIDWDFSGPVDPVLELAHACWLNAKLHDDTVAEREGLESAEERARQVQLLIDGYGLEKRYRQGFVQKIIDAAILETAAEADLAHIGPRTLPESVAAEMPWAIAWRARAARWMIENRRLLEDAVG